MPEETGYRCRFHGGTWDGKVKMLKRRLLFLHVAEVPPFSPTLKTTPVSVDYKIPIHRYELVNHGNYRWMGRE